MTLSKRLLISLGAVSLLTHTAFASSTAKTEKSCGQGCPFWEITEMENFFNRPFSRLNNVYTASTMKEDAKAYLISIDLPGMDKKDISIQISANRLMISGERKEEFENKEGSKKSYRQFNQSFTLPADADLEAISAISTNGVLKITVPKTGKKTSKKIEIK